MSNNIPLIELFSETGVIIVVSQTVRQCVKPNIIVGHAGQSRYEKKKKTKLPINNWLIDFKKLSPDSAEIIQGLQPSKRKALSKISAQEKKTLASTGLCPIISKQCQTQAYHLSS